MLILSLLLRTDCSALLKIVLFNKVNSHSVYLIDITLSWKQRLLILSYPAQFRFMPTVLLIVNNIILFHAQSELNIIICLLNEYAFNSPELLSGPAMSPAEWLWVREATSFVYSYFM